MPLILIFSTNILDNVLESYNTQNDIIYIVIYD